jgi:nucleotide-binding universal stress UspA family protein
MTSRGPTRAPTRIVVGYDGSPESEAALGWAASLAAALGAVVRAVHAVGLLEHARLTPLAVHEQRARAVVTGAGLDASRFEWHVVDGEPGSVLRRESEGVHAGDLLVVGTRGAGAHPGTLLGSTSLGLAERAPVPVVVVPAPVHEAGPLAPAQRIRPPGEVASPGEVAPRRAPGESPPA